MYRLHAISISEYWLILLVAFPISHTGVCICVEAWLIPFIRPVNPWQQVLIWSRRPAGMNALALINPTPPTETASPAAVGTDLPTWPPFCCLYLPPELCKLLNDMLAFSHAATLARRVSKVQCQMAPVPLRCSVFRLLSLQCWTNIAIIYRGFDFENVHHHLL